MGYNKEENDDLVIEQKSTPKVDESLKKDITEQNISEGIEQPQQGVASLLGKDIEGLKKILGNPSRVDLSAYGFHWWIFNNDPDQYIQAGVLNDKVVTAYAIGPKVDVLPFKIGQPIEEIFSMNVIEPEVTFEYNGSSYKFELSEQDMNTRPVIKMGDYFVQLYIDKFTSSVSSIRYMDKETIIKQRPYEMVYRGTLIEPPVLSDGDWVRIEAGLEKQILDITNAIRSRHELQLLEWDEKTAEVAYAHSKDMAIEDYFSHESEKYGDLSERLKAAEILYEVAGENIAANYTDAPAVVEGWLNSESHREALLNEDFSHLGVGVYQKHYTQNFLKMWNQQ
ncbi:CAP domain-containing protein [Mesobacillus sp. AQ2]|uniref:CAP domain-containing protein n=1 Tax=unclassified Mesobacillus TaxID=2675270 RepID=UPI00203DD2C5|nr:MULTISPECIES: CAP domain-containing protein [unclassified Mesobacillus]MCM3123437.1 CAP domain-containing protein [Mesobacillus sp. MER 33]MCM3233080.1 CAP domain-containing protein [Mesobacillus sp. MER 48]WHX42154.1 CAP domain-containing protein [Mesobacillus sp. AQ2]